VEQIAAIEKDIADWITMHLTIVILIGVGLFLTGRSLAVQVRLFPEMIRTVLDSRKGAEGGISSFQAFAISLAARVGIGNVFGVAAALLMGGPGAIFWMWVVALVGMGTAFFEATLAQIFKVKHSDGSFRGGPAYYMKRGMKNRVLANIFAVITVVTCGIVITFVDTIRQRTATCDKNALPEGNVEELSSRSLILGLEPKRFVLLHRLINYLIHPLSCGCNLLPEAILQPLCSHVERRMRTRGWSGKVNRIPIIANKRITDKPL